MTELEKQLLATELNQDEAQPRLMICSRMRIDAGLWWRKTRLWVCVMNSELILLAVARRRYIERISFSDLMQSRYSHESGELVFAPIETVRFPRITMSPRNALHVLNEIQNYAADKGAVTLELHQNEQNDEKNVESFENETEA